MILTVVCLLPEVVTKASHHLDGVVIQVSNCDVKNNQHETKGRPFEVTALIYFHQHMVVVIQGGDGLDRASRRALTLGKLFS